MNFKIRPLVTEYALMIKLVDGTNSTHSFNHYHAYFGHSWSYFDIQNLRYLLYYTLHSHAKSMNEITVTLSFSNTHTIYKEKGQNFPKNSKFPKFQKFQNIKFPNFQESYAIKQLLHLNLINMRFFGASPMASCNRTFGHSQDLWENIPVYCTRNH